jgi:transposase-like protein
MAKHGLRDPDLRRLRALRIVEMRIRGKSIPEIAREFGVEDKTVHRDLSWAKKAELVIKAEDKILRELVPAAHKAIAEVFAGVNDEVKAKTALQIFEKTLPSFSKTPKASGATVAPESDLSTYISSLRDAAGLLDGAVDGDVIADDGRTPLASLLEGGTFLALPPAEAEASPDSLPAPAAGPESAAE